MLRSFMSLLLLAGASAPVSPAQSFVEPPDEITYRILFTIMRSAPPPHWDLQTKVNWLASTGLTSAEVYALQTVASRYWDVVTPLDSELRAVNDRFKGHNDAPEAELATRPIRDRITAEYQASLLALSKEIGAAGMEKVTRHIQAMKKNMARPARQAVVVHSHPQ